MDHYSMDILLQWISRILKRETTIGDLRGGNLLITLAKSTFPRIQVMKMNPLAAASKRFSAAACSLDKSTQAHIYDLIHDPLMLLDSGKPFTRNCILSKVNPSTDAQGCDSMTYNQSHSNSLLAPDHIDIEIKLEECVRTRCKLQSDLEHERAYRDELEGVVVELRKQVDDIRLKLSESEAKNCRLTSDLSVFHDQSDELNYCRVELANLQEDRAGLKQRLEQLQETAARIRNLENTNVVLKKEREDYRLKVEQLTEKLSEIKDRRMVCAEVEVLRSKLRDAEVQLSQHLLERESAVRDARRHNDLINEMKLQQMLKSKNRLDISSADVSCDAVTVDQDNDDKRTIGESKVLRQLNDGQTSDKNRNYETLGHVIEQELDRERLSNQRLQSELENALEKVSLRDHQLGELQQRVSSLASQLSNTCAQHQLTQSSLEAVNGDLDSLHSDLAHVESYLIDASSAPETIIDSVVLLGGKLESTSSSLARPIEPIARLSGQLLNCLARQLITHDSQLNQLRLELTGLGDALRVRNKEFDTAKDQFAVVQRELDDALRTKVEELEAANAQLEATRSKLNDALIAKCQLDQLLYLEPKLDVECQTDPLPVQLPINPPQHLMVDSIEHLMTSSVNNLKLQSEEEEEQQDADEDVDALTHVNDLSADPAYEASVADRRGLSSEVIRLNADLQDKATYINQLELTADCLRSELDLLRDEHGKQSTVLDRANQEWARIEKERLALVEYVEELREKYFNEVQTLRELVNRRNDQSLIEASTTATLSDHLKHVYANESSQLKEKLSRACVTIQKLEQEKQNLQYRLEALLIESTSRAERRSTQPRETHSAGSNHYPSTSGRWSKLSRGGSDKWPVNSRVYNGHHHSDETDNSLSDAPSLPRSCDVTNGGGGSLACSYADEIVSDDDDLATPIARPYDARLSMALNEVAKYLPPPLTDDQFSNHRQQQPLQSSRSERVLMTDDSTLYSQPSHRPASSQFASDQMRIPELLRRNKLQPQHLKTSYPIETQTYQPRHVADALSNYPPSSLNGADNNGRLPPLRSTSLWNGTFNHKLDKSEVLTEMLLSAVRTPTRVRKELAKELERSSAQVAELNGTGNGIRTFLHSSDSTLPANNSYNPTVKVERQSVPPSTAFEVCFDGESGQPTVKTPSRMHRLGQLPPSRSLTTASRLTNSSRPTVPSTIRNNSTSLQRKRLIINSQR